MMTRRVLAVSVAMVLACSSFVVPQAAAQAKRGTKAGQVTAVLPVAKVYRGTGKAQTAEDAKRSDEILWNDMIRTERGGRIRITLNDQSLISLGSQAELRVVKHDQRTQQTALQLGYGRVRAEVASIIRDSGRFELRTPTAVAGVIGTDFGSDANLPGVTAFICISGITNLSNANPDVPGTVPCPAGTYGEVKSGMTPTTQPATQQQIQQLIQDTEPAVIGSMTPSASLPGATFAAAVSGSKMAGINAVSVSGAGVTASLSGTPTDTSLNLNITVAADAAPGPRTFTFVKASGAATAVVFNVLSPPNVAGALDLGALKKSYTDILEQERQSEISGINAIGLGVQQSAAAIQQQLAGENGKLPQPLDQSKIDKSLQDDSQPLLDAMVKAGANLNGAVADATTKFNSDADAAAQKNAGKSDQDIRNAVKDAFDKVNKELLAKIKGIHDGLGGDAKSANARLNADLTRWLEQLKVEMAKQNALPNPNVNKTDVSFEVGQDAEFDGSRSTGISGGSITGYQWQVCDPAYKPQQTGVVIPVDNKCNPLSGYASNSVEFKFPTCNLNGGTDYIVRLIVTDDRGKQAAIDVRTRMNPITYDPPDVRMRGLADAYISLLPARFMAFFAEDYSGFAPLSENIRRTFDNLSSMLINLRVSQNTVICNEANLRADWQQNFTFKAAANLACAQASGSVCVQQEQLQMKMKRIPGRGWYITDLTGDNGTVQGVPPGPLVDAGRFDLSVNSVTPIGPYIGTQPGAVDVEVENHGTADSPANAFMTVTLGGVVIGSAANPPNGRQAPVVSGQIAVPPVRAGQKVTVRQPFTLPNVAGSQTLQVDINAPGDTDNTNNDSSNSAGAVTISVTQAVVDLGANSLALVGGAPFLTGTSRSVTFNVTNAGNVPSNIADTYTCTISGSPYATGTIPSVPAGGSTVITATGILPATPGTGTVLCVAGTDALETVITNNATTTGITTVAPFVDLKISALAFGPGGNPPFLSGTIVRNVIFSVTNNGNVPSAATDAYVCKITGSTAPGAPASVSLVSAALGAIAPAGGVVNITANFAIPVNYYGNDSIICEAAGPTVGRDPQEAAGTLTDNTSGPLAALVNPNIDLQLQNVPTPPAANQMGETITVPVFQVLNAGLDTAAAGWNVIFDLNGSTLSSLIGPQLAGGASTSINLPSAVIPQIQAAPADVPNVPAFIQVNANAAVPETNPNNNIVNRTFRLVDFTLTAAGPYNAVVSRTFTATGAITILPAAYPLPIVVNYSGLPAGINPSGASGADLTSGGVGGTANTAVVTASATVNGVTHGASGPITINVFNEITATQVNTPTLVAAAGGGPTQNIDINVSGGIYPLTIAFTPGTGIIATGPTTLAAPGLVTLTLKADLTAPIGPQSLPFSASDIGSSPNTPSFARNIPVNFSVNQFVDLKLVSVTNTGAAFPWLSGQARQITLSVQNNGNGVSSAADIYTCTLNGGGTPVVIGTATIAPIGGGQTTSIPVNFNVPIDQAPGGNIACVLSQDPAEANLSDNAAPLNGVVINLNADLTVTSIVGPTPAVQAGAAGGFLTATIRNNGLDTAPAVWVVNFVHNAVGVGSLPGAALAGGGTVNMTLSGLVFPSPGPGAQDVIQPISATVSLTGDTVPGNDTLGGTVRNVDFTIAAAPSFPTTGVATRTYSQSPAFTVTTVGAYPLSINLVLSGQPAGITLPGGITSATINAGAVIDLTGTPTVTGPFTANLAATVSGLTKNASGAVTIDPEINATFANPAVALTQGGAAGTLSGNVSGGIGNVTYTLALPTGITIVAGANPQVVNGTGSVSWDIQSTLASTAGLALTNISITATDAGNSPIVPAGNKSFNPPYNNGGQDNYILQASTTEFASPYTSGVGTDALQFTQPATMQVDVKNIGTLGQAGTINLQMTCAPTACGTNTTSVAAPAPNATVTASFAVPAASFQVGSTTPSFVITSAPPQTSTADDNFTGSQFDVYDFNLTLASGFPTQNIPVGGNGQFAVVYTEFGTPVNTISLSVGIPASGVPGVGYGLNATQSLSLNNPNTVTVSASGGVTPGATETAVYSATRFGATRSASQPLKFYDASIQNVTAGGLGSTNANPIPLAIGGGPGTVSLKLLGTWAGNGSLVSPSQSFFSFVVNGTPQVPNDTFTIDISALNGASLTVQNIPVTFDIPNTNPPQSVTTQVWVLPQATPDLTVDVPVFTNTSCASPRDYAANPLLSGEECAVDVTVRNTGTGALFNPDVTLNLRLGGPAGQILLTTNLGSPIGPGAQATISTFFILPDPLPTGSSQIYAEVLPDPGEINTANNNNNLPVNTADWSIVVSGNGTSASPLNVSASSTTPATLQIQTTAGAPYAPIFVVNGILSSHVSPSTNLPVALTSVFNTNMNIGMDATAQTGPYLAQAIAQLKDPSGTVSTGAITAFRGATVHVNVTGAGVPTVTLASSKSNVLAGAGGSCTGGCTPVQINGLLVEDMNLTPTITPGTVSSTVDLVFTDDPILVSNTDGTGSSQLNPILQAVPNNTPAHVYFSPTDVAGVITPGPAKTVISATAVIQTPRTIPIPEQVGNQQSTLFFNIGDLAVSPTPGCIAIPENGGQTTVQIDWVPLNGYNENFTFTWTNLYSNTDVSVDTPTGSVNFSSGYAPNTFTFTNSLTGPVSTQVEFVITIDTSNTNGPVSETFKIPVYLNGTGCLAANPGRGVGAAARAGVIRGTWVRGRGTGGTASSGAGRKSRIGPLPDLQIKAGDVSYTPSLPQRGDTVNIRYKVNNLGDAAAKAPIMLEVNGHIMATEEVDIAAGSSTLGVFEFNTAQLGPPQLQSSTTAVVRPVALTKGARPLEHGGPSSTGDANRDSRSGQGFTVRLLIDPQGTVKMKTLDNKMVPVRGLSVVQPLGDVLAQTGSLGGAGLNRVMVEVASACIGLRVATGSQMGCESADLDIMVLDAASARYVLRSLDGVADLGMVDPATADASRAQFTSQLPAQSGHTYAVRLSGGQIAVFKVDNILSPRQLELMAQKRFQGGSRRMLRGLAGDSQPVAAGDTTGTVNPNAIVYFDLILRSR